MTRRPRVDPLCFSGGTLDRAYDGRRDPEWIRDQLRAEGTRVVAVHEGKVLVCQAPEGGIQGVHMFPPRALREGVDPPGEWIFLGMEDDAAVFAAEVRDRGAMSVPDPHGHGHSFVDMRRAGAILGQGEGALLAYAAAMITWSRSARRCGECGGATRPRHGGHIRNCAEKGCAAEYFPRTDPAVIVLVHDGSRCLLGRKETWPAGVYSCIAGFVEPGESMEEAVVREVLEETGITVGDVLYRGSQPWPFPRSLMVGFFAEKRGGTIKVDPEELADARWFTRAEVVERRRADTGLPGRISIARRLIEDWLDEF